LEVTGKSPLLDLAMELERIALEDDYFVSRRLYPNVDFYSGIIYQAVGFPVDMFPVLFAIARTAGWLAQWQEMLEDKDRKIGRPRNRAHCRLARAAAGDAGAEGLEAHATATGLHRGGRAAIREDGAALAARRGPGRDPGPRSIPRILHQPVPADQLLCRRPAPSPRDDSRRELCCHRRRS